MQEKTGSEGKKTKKKKCIFCRACKDREESKREMNKGLCEKEKVEKRESE